MTHLAALAALQQTLDANPAWEMAKGIALFVSTSGISYGVLLLRKIVAGQQRHDCDDCYNAEQDRPTA
jgi:hypothetical protein